MRKICFFNHYHNGDLFHGKAFIRELMYNVETDFIYSHSMNPAVLADMDGLQYEPMVNMPTKARYLDLGDTFLINTWIGAYFGHGIKYDFECTLRFTHQMYARIYDLINQVFPGTGVVLGPVESYVPFVNYGSVNKRDVHAFLVANPRIKVLFSNGPCHSGQCAYNGDMKPIIEEVAKRHPIMTFVATHKFDTEQKNIKFTSDIIDQTSGCDLNEISYLSTYCDLIVGRNSGPYCFTVTDTNTTNPDKTFYSFGESDDTMFMKGIDTPAKFIFEKYTSLDNTFQSISNLVNQLEGKGK
jgi:hypothetical protein